MKHLSLCILTISLLGCIKAVGPLPPAPPAVTLATVISAATGAAEILLAIVGNASGLTKVQQDAISGYIQGIGNAASASADEIQSADSAADKATKLTDIWSAVVLSSSILNGLPASVRGYVEAAASAVKAVMLAISQTLGNTSGVSAKATQGAAKPMLVVGAPEAWKAIGARGAALKGHK